MQYFKPEIPFYKFNVTMYCNKNVKLSNWINSAVRGSLGNKLIKLCCDKSHNDCISCNNLECSAKNLYGTASPEDSSQQFNPYIIYCPETCFDGHTINFTITLFGNGTKSIKDVLKVLSNGLSISGYDFYLTSIIDDFCNDIIFDGFMWVIPEPYYPNFEYNLPVNKIDINLITPFSCKQNNKVPDFDYIVRSSMRRTSTILKSCNVNCSANYKQLLELTKSIVLISRDVHLVSKQRHSNRTNLDMKICGYMGRLSFKGDITPFIPFFGFSQLTGIGKLCVMGFGQLKCLYTY